MIKKCFSLTPYTYSVKIKIYYFSYVGGTNMFGLGATELIIIFLIILILFGVGKLPEIGSGLGKAIKNFKKATSEDEADLTKKS